MVRPDAEEGFRQALDHLIRHGHRRVALVGRNDAREGTQRQWRSTYESAIGELGVAVDPALIVTVLNSREGGRRATRTIIESGSPFTAVLACSDEMAAGAMSVLREAGLRVPGDVAVAGMGDVLEGAALDPPLTTAHTGTFEFGCRALALAAEEGLALHARLFLQGDCRDHLVDRARPRIEVGEQVDQLAHRQPGLKARGLQLGADARLDAGRVDRMLHAGHRDRSPVRFPRPENTLDRGRLARAVGPEQAENLARPCAKGHAVDGHGLAVALVQVVYLHGHLVDRFGPPVCCASITSHRAARHIVHEGIPGPVPLSSVQTG
jgi:hypothetical protein